MKNISSFIKAIVLFFIITLYPITLILDPGHGGKFTGCISCNNLIKEKDITLTIAQKIAKELKKNTHLNVILTRTEDTQQAENLMDDLLTRVEMARIYQADFFISIHLNATAKNPETTRGFEIYVPMHTDYPAQSYLLASFIHHALSQNTEPEFAGNLGNLNIRDRGIRAAKFNVIFKAPCPAVLVELDYLTHPEAEALYLSEEYQDFIALTVTKAIEEYLLYVQ